jgi:hypothetical protein
MVRYNSCQYFNSVYTLLYLLYLIRPSGETRYLSLSNTNNDFVVVRYPPNIPEQAYFVSPVGSIEDLYNDYFHYYITTLIRGPVHCIGCEKALHHNDMTIQTRAICIF